MVLSQRRSKRMVSGKKYRKDRKKRLFELSGIQLLTTIGKKIIKFRRVRGGDTKRKILHIDFVNISEKGKTKKLKILSVVENPSNKNFSRRSIITKGTIVETEKGNVKITSRPGQDGTLNGVFV